MSQEQEQTQEASQQVQHEQPAATPQQDNTDIFADHITEEMLGAMLDDDKKEDQPKGDEPEHDEPQEPETAKSEEPNPEEQPEKQPEEQPQEPEAYELELFGKPAKLTGDQLTDLAEAGAQFIQHRPQVQQAMQLIQAVQNDPKLQDILAAYSKGQPLPQIGARPKGPLEVDPNDPIANVRAQVMAEIVPALKQQLMEEIEQRYKPFVDDVNAFAAEHRREKEFGKYAADPEYQAVNDLMQRNIQRKVQDGSITYEQAAQIDAALKSDPKLYGEWFGRFKEAAVKGRQQVSDNAQAAVNQSGGQVKTVPRAPRLESAAAQGDAEQEKYKQLQSRALAGDTAALGALL